MNSYAEVVKGCLVYFNHRNDVCCGTVVAVDERARTLTVRRDKASKPIKVDWGYAYVVPAVIPKVWYDILDAHGEDRVKDIRVCYLPFTDPPATTLFHTQTLDTLIVRETTNESGSVKLWPNHDGPTYHRLEVTDGETVFEVGGVALDMSADQH